MHRYPSSMFCTPFVAVQNVLKYCASTILMPHISLLRRDDIIFGKRFISINPGCPSSEVCLQIEPILILTQLITATKE